MSVAASGDAVKGVRVPVLRAVIFLGRCGGCEGEEGWEEEVFEEHFGLWMVGWLDYRPGVQVLLYPSTT